MSDAKIIPNPYRPGEDMMLITEFDGLEKNKKFYQFYFIDKTKKQEGLQGPFDLEEISSGTGINIQSYYNLGTQKVADNNKINTNLSIYRGPKKENVITTFDELEQYKSCYQFYFIEDSSFDQTLKGPYDLKTTTEVDSAWGTGSKYARTSYTLNNRDVADIEKKKLNEYITIFLGPEKSGPGCNISGGTRRKKSRKSKKSKKSRKSKKSKKSRKSRRSRK